MSSADDEEWSLPRLEGGWKEQSFPLRGGASVRLMVPSQPDALLDDAEVQERNRYNDSMPYWAWLWEAGPKMVQALGSRPITGSVLEVGAGLGLVGIALALESKVLSRGSIELTLSDHDPQSVAALRANAQLNGLENARVWSLDWRQLDAAPEESFDAVIGCDVIYEGQNHGPLLDTLERFVGGGGSRRALLADPGRQRVPQFMKRAESRGFRARLTDIDGADAEPEIGAFRVIELQLSAD